MFDAAERVFALRGFDGATIRDIAAEAGEPVGTIHHHGGGKEALIHKVVARRAEVLSRARLQALDRVEDGGDSALEAVLTAFIRPFFEFCAEDPAWRDYARLVAFVSVDERWRDISAQHFDPTADRFIAHIRACLPDSSPVRIAEGFVYCVSAMLALLTSQRRIDVLAGGAAPDGDEVARLVRFCAAGLRS